MVWCQLEWCDVEICERNLCWCCAVPPLFVIEFLHRVVNTFEDYFNECNETTLKDNYVIVYEVIVDSLMSTVLVSVAPCQKLTFVVNWWSCCPQHIHTVIICQLLDTCNSAVAWSIAGVCRSAHVTDTLASFHWLRAPERIMFELAIAVYWARLRLGICLTGWAVLLTCRLGDDFGLQLQPTVLSQLANDHLLSLAESCGTVFQMTLHLLHRWQCFSKNWKHIYFGSHIRTLFCSLFCDCSRHMVILAVIYFGCLKSCYIM